MEFIVDHAEARFAIVEDQEQVDKLLQVRRAARGSSTSSTTTPAGSGTTRTPGSSAWRPSRSSGGAFDQSTPATSSGRWRRAQADDVAIICYTSGTTGQPKGTMLSLPEPDRHRPERDRVRGPARHRRGRRVPARWRGSATTCSRSRSRSSPASRPTARRARRPCSQDLRRSARPTSSPRRDLPAHPDHGHDPDRGLGAGQASAWSASSWIVARRVERRRLAGRPVPPGDRLPPRAGPGARLRPAAGQPRDEPGPSRVHRRGGDRAGAIRVLSGARREHEAALRHDRVRAP